MQFNRFQSVSRRSMRGFTLVELLIVMVIISILLGFLLPALRHTQQQAHATTCASNLKQIGYAMLEYAGSWKWYPPVAGCQSDDKPWWPVRLGKYLKDERIFRCPTARAKYSDLRGEFSHDQAGNDTYPGGWSVDGTASPADAPYWTTYHGNAMQDAHWGPGGSWQHPDKRGFCFEDSGGAGVDDGNWKHGPRRGRVQGKTIYLVDGKIDKAPGKPGITDEDSDKPDYADIAEQTYVGNYHPDEAFNALYADGRAQQIFYGASEAREWAIRKD